MPISDDINKHLAKLSSTAKHDDIVTYAKEQLTAGVFTAQEILDYATGYRFTKEPKPYVINAATINRIGIVVGQLDDKEQAKLDIQFHKLAAERNSSWGNRNYAQCLINQKKAKESLPFIVKARELAAAEKINPSQYQYLHFQGLRANQQSVEAHIALVDYLKFKLSEKDSKEEVQRVFTTLKQLMAEFQTSITTITQQSSIEESWRYLLQALDPFVTVTIGSCPDYSVIQQQVYWFIAQCHEKLGQAPQAMKAYCEISNKLLPFYVHAVESRARLLKQQIAKDLALLDVESKPPEAVETVASTVGAMLSVAPSAVNAEEENKEEKPAVSSPIATAAITDTDAKLLPDAKSKKRKADDPLVLPGDIPLSTYFNRSWTVNSKSITAKFDKRVAELAQLISAKKIELVLVEEALKDPGNEAKADHPLVQKQKTLQTELAELDNVQAKLEQQRDKYSYERRQPFRRYAAEVNFFNSRRSKKRAEIAKLAGGIIDQRFNPSDTAREPLKLVTSTRAVISAERAFQEAAIALSSSATPRLGVPVAREKAWLTHSYSGKTGYGPVEHYQVGGTDITSEHRTEPKRQRLGDSFLPQHGTYSTSIYPFLSDLVGDNRENQKTLATFMLRYGRTHQEVTIEELQTIKATATADDVKQFTRICFLIMEKEQAQWHSATQEDYQLGMAVAQARCLIMMEAGFIDIEEAFKNNTLFGIYSQTEIINRPEKVAAACKHIDTLYMAYLDKKHPKDHFSFLKRHVAAGDATPIRILTRKQAHEDLKQVHGGDSDTDDEGYDTDLDIEPISPTLR